jgi:hypothetical protein
MAAKIPENLQEVLRVYIANGGDRDVADGAAREFAKIVAERDALAKTLAVYADSISWEDVRGCAESFWALTDKGPDLARDALSKQEE